MYRTTDTKTKRDILYYILPLQRTIFVLLSHTIGLWNAPVQSHSLQLRFYAVFQDVLCIFSEGLGTVTLSVSKIYLVAGLKTIYSFCLFQFCLPFSSILFFALPGFLVPLPMPWGCSIAAPVVKDIKAQLLLA